VSAGGARLALVTGATGGIGAARCRALAAEGLRVAVHHRSDANAIVPGFVETPMTGALPAAARDARVARIPLGRMGLPEEVAEVGALLATRGSSVHGAAIHVNGGPYGG
jgi:3-oxoacyl-[acyl-carrier protein] reductase